MSEWFIHLPGGLTMLVVEDAALPSVYDAMVKREAALAYSGTVPGPALRRTHNTIRDALESVRGRRNGHADLPPVTLQETGQRSVIGRPDTLTTAQLASLLGCSERHARRRADAAQVTPIARGTWAAEDALTITQCRRAA